MRENYGVEPNLRSYNILLHALATDGRLSEAMETFYTLCSLMEPDAYTISIMMWLAGDRGDLDLALELYDMARELSIPLSSHHIKPLIMCYCQHDMITQAEQLAWVSMKGKIAAAERVHIWNTILDYHAIHHNLPAAQRVLDIMSRLKITYNADTYTALFTVLSNCRQPHHIKHLLEVGATRGLFEPTVHHYVIYTASLLLTKQYALAMKVHQFMADSGHPKTSQQLLVILRTLGSWRQHKRVEAHDIRALGKALRTFFDTLDNALYYPSYPVPKLGDFGLVLETSPEDVLNPWAYKAEGWAVGTPGEDGGATETGMGMGSSEDEAVMAKSGWSAGVRTGDRAGLRERSTVGVGMAKGGERAVYITAARSRGCEEGTG